MPPLKQSLTSSQHASQGYLRDTTLVKNANYWKEGVPYLDGVKYFIITDNNTIMAA